MPKQTLGEAMAALTPAHQAMVQKLIAAKHGQGGGSHAVVTAVLANTEAMMHEAVAAIKAGTPVETAVQPLRDGLAFLQAHVDELLP